MKNFFLLILPLFFFLSCNKEASDSNNKLPKQVFMYSGDINHLASIQNIKYDNYGKKIEVLTFDKDNIHYSNELIEYNTDGLIFKQHFLYKQPDGTFRENHSTGYTYQPGQFNKLLLIKDENFSNGELSTWRTYSYFNNNLQAIIYKAKFGADTSISGKNEYEYDAQNRIRELRRFYSTNNIPSYNHEYVYQNDLLIKENITTYLYPETTEYTYNKSNQLVSKKHYEGSLLLDSEINTYDDYGRLSKKVIYNIQTSSYINTTILLYNY